MRLAAAVGSPAPTITALTQLAAMINGIDYPREGLTLQQMGLAERLSLKSAPTSARPPPS
jgi:hypothetical protein